MRTNGKFKDALKEMMEQMSLDQINVTSLCQKCKVHRQTFYYHYRNIYDLIGEIFLDERIPDLDRAKDPKNAILKLVGYAKNHFAFLKATYGSSAHDIADSFVLSKMMTKFLEIAVLPEQGGLNKKEARILARRMGSIVEDEFRFVFRDLDVTPLRFEKRMRKFANLANDKLYPALVAMAKEEHD